VADSIPTAEIAKIPPSVPVYNLTYVAVYASTPQVVYVGYTPGYTGAYPYYGVPVYGTGWHYPPYVGAVYYPHPVTYGVAVSYNPYTGYGMGTTFGAGFLAFGIGVAIGSSSRGYYPAGGYRACYNCTVNGRRGVVAPEAGIRSTSAIRRAGKSAAGRSGGDRAAQQLRTRISTTARRTRGARPTARRVSKHRVNWARTERRRLEQRVRRSHGNVHRRTNSGWESRQGNNWSRDRAGSNYGSRGGGNREYGARQRSSGASRGGGGRGGGGRRR
jgi:hypothetical protein